MARQRIERQGGLLVWLSEAMKLVSLLIFHGDANSLETQNTMLAIVSAIVTTAKCHSYDSSIRHLAVLDCTHEKPSPKRADIQTITPIMKGACFRRAVSFQLLFRRSEI